MTNKEECNPILVHAGFRYIRRDGSIMKHPLEYLLELTGEYYYRDPERNTSLTEYGRCYNFDYLSPNDLVKIYLEPYLNNRTT